MFIVTLSGARFDFEALATAQVKVEDIAHALSWINRFTGHARFGFSVAAHSLAVADFLAYQGESAQVQLGGLTHDAHEAYFGDIATPLKRYLDIDVPLRALGIDQATIDALLLNVRAREDAVQDTVAEKLGLDVRMMRCAAVKRADLLALYVERHALLPADGPAESVWPMLAGITPEMCIGMPAPERKHSPEDFTEMFLERFHRLYREVQADRERTFNASAVAA